MFCEHARPREARPMLSGMRLRRGLPVVAAIAGLVVTLCACSAAPLVAMRVNDDGSIDVAACNSVSEIERFEAYTTLRTGPSGTVDESTRVDLIAPDVTSLKVGEVVTFEGLPADWDRVDIWVTEGEWMSWVLERERAQVGEWYWNDWGFGSTYPAERCVLKG
jgi:hypothetical protein